MTKSNYAELAKQTNGIGAALSTVFLFTRLWARSTQYKGLWWDDYLRELKPGPALPPAPAWALFSDYDVVQHTMIQYSILLEKSCQQKLL